ncbi:MAG: flagellar basal-body MS-ring/collar protein FliF [Candidatus Eisenbacteria bacterium]
MSRLGAFWRRLTPNQRVLFGSLGAGLVLLIGLLINWAAQPEYGVLFANLEPSDGSSILDRLRSDKVPYQVKDGGRTILVPQSKVYETRLSLAGQGLPGSGTGYELLDTNKLGWTDFVQKLQYHRALEGEIARTIQTLDEVSAARVHLVMPEPSLFTSEEKPTTASVVLRMKPGARLAAGQVRGIVHLVSSAVEGLKPDNVTILDVMGNLLSQPRQDPLIGATSDQIALVHGLEEQLTGKVQTLLETVLGPGKSVVRIAAEMNFEKKESTTEQYDADNPVVRSEEKTNQTGSDGQRTESATTNYEISKKTEHVSSPTGVIKRLTASVFVDGSYKDAGKGQREYVPRSPEELKKYENIIRTAIGFDATRGDQLTVENVAFDTSLMDRERKEMEKSERMQLFMQLGGKLGSLLLVLALLLFLVRLMRRVPGVETRTSAVDVTVGGGPAGLLELGPSANSEYALIQEKLVALSKEQPEDLSRLIRIWLRESM